jgi:hypothetical protein
MAGICPECWREHTGKCDTRTLEERQAAANAEAARKAAERIAKERKGKR